MVYWRARFLSCVVRSRRTGSSTPGPSFHRWSSGSLHTLTGFHQYRKHVSGSGSVRFRPPWSGSAGQRNRSGSRSSHHQAKTLRKPLISTLLWLLYEFLSVKNDVNVASKSNKQKHWIIHKKTWGKSNSSTSKSLTVDWEEGPAPPGWCHPCCSRLLHSSCGPAPSPSSARIVFRSCQELLPPVVAAAK